MNQMEMVSKIQEVLADNCDDPATEIIKLGTAMVAIGTVLKELPLSECRAIISAVQTLAPTMKAKEKP